MKKKNFDNQWKNIIYILGYWAIFIGIPSLATIWVKNIKYTHNDLPIWIVVYFMIIAPFLYIIPYQLAKPKSKFWFIFLGLIVPYLFIYFLIYQSSRGFGSGIG